MWELFDFDVAAVEHTCRVHAIPNSTTTRNSALIGKIGEGWRREWDSNSPASLRFCKLQIPHCQGCRECQRCRGALPAMARTDESWSSADDPRYMPAKCRSKPPRWLRPRRPQQTARRASNLLLPVQRDHSSRRARSSQPKPTRSCSSRTRSPTRSNCRSSNSARSSGFSREVSPA
jgi:hypothetical protein